MRRITFAFAVVMFCFICRYPAIAADPLAELYEADFITCTEVLAQLPHGELAINDGVVAIFSGLDQRLAGILVGDVDVYLDTLPSGQGVLNIFAELEPEKRELYFHVTKAYLSASPTGQAQIIPSGYTLNIRSWEELDQAEQAEFESIYLQAASDGWLAESTESPGHWAGGGQAATTELTLRNPVAEEVFTAMWTDDGNRFDYRVEAEGVNVSITDYYRDITFYQHPWAPEQGELDPTIAFKEAHYLYTFSPPSDNAGERKLGQLEAVISIVFSVTEPRDQLALVSYPWLSLFQVTDPAGNPYVATRGGEGYSDWMLFVTGSFSPGPEYVLNFEFIGDVPDSYDGIGYAGVYRFDTSALWLGENHPAMVTIELQLPPDDWHYVASESAWVDAPPDRPTATALWNAVTRNQMLVATKFPAVEVETDWGALEVYAPPELIDSLTAMHTVNAVGPIIDYYSVLWGDRGVTRQPVFLIPDEHGVQAFMDASFVFILGGDRSGIPLVAHEVAHLWWGQDVSAPLWFLEGMANYGAAKFIEYYYGESGPATGQNDPLFYRRYLINFGLGYELPLSFDRREALEDAAAIYHNSAGFLLTCDNRLPRGLDPLLAQIHEAQTGQPQLDHGQLRQQLLELGDDTLAGLWDVYVERGEIPYSTDEDETYREFVLTPERENYIKLLRWLTPAYKKGAVGDFAGALYCASQALDYRSEPKDFFFIADLAFRAGRIEEALERATVLMENPKLDDKTRARTNYLFARIFQHMGDPVNERAALEAVIADGPAAGLMLEVQEAQSRLDELAQSDS